MRRTHVQITSFLLAGALLAAAGNAVAQDTQFLPTDVLLLVDTSGSMGLTTFRENGLFAEPKCGTWAQPKRIDMNAAALEDSTHTWTAPDRWMMLVKTLTGSVTDMACVRQPRTDLLFQQEYALGATPTSGAAPIDSEYTHSYNRIVARSASAIGCTPAPSWDAGLRAQLADNALLWPTAGGGPVYWREIGAFTGGSNPACSFTAQDSDGLLDAYADRARFGLMTFDTEPAWNDNGTKKVGIGMVPGSYDAVYPAGIGDTWSYYPNWLTDIGPVPAGAGQGNLGGCVSVGAAALWENGSRNPAAPPWEGRLMTFGKPDATTAEIVAWNERVQNALLTARPYNQTPVAGMLADAKAFLLNDNNNIDPYVGGKIDPDFKTTLGKGCRKRKVILFTDGGPNWDLRPQCEVSINGVPGKCPYPKPQDTAKELADNNIPVYVVGLSVSNGAQTCKQMFDANAAACNTLPPCDTTCATNKCAYGYCINDPNPLNAQKLEALSQCCVVKSIAEKGGTTNAFFVENQSELAAAFGEILKKAANVNSSRSVPVAAGLSQATGAQKDPNAPGLVGARFFTSFHDVDYDLLSGTVERQRYVCSNGGAALSQKQDIDKTKGDDFQTRVDGPANSYRPNRLVYTVVGDTVTNKILSERSIRPLYNPPSSGGDGLGSYGGTMVSGLASQIVGNNALDLALLGANKTCGGTGCCFPTPSQAAPTASQCRERFLQEELGLKVTGNSDITFLRSSAMGAVVHSYPVVVEAPAEITSESSYVNFRSAFAKRGSLMYAATVDGQLHAFKIWDVQQTTNELWTFIPPAVLSKLDQQFQDRYKATAQYLLDGPLMVRDVAGTVEDATTHRFLTRTVVTAKNPAATRWYTILLGSFGKFGGFYALDVSWPDKDSVNSPPSGYTKGPRFLWQLTTDADGQPLFGDRSATPSIATLYFQMPGSSEPAAEHAVAILPGGMGGQPLNSQVTVNYSATPLAFDSNFSPKTETRKYASLDLSAASKRSFGGARSITIVRLDTGEVVRTLRYGLAAPDAADMQAPQGLYDKGRVSSAKFDAPMSGQAVSYPAGAGAVADRAYVGDAEGHLWRVNLSNPDPSKWDAYMLFDAYPATVANKTGYTWDKANPIQTSPVVSTNSLGQVVLAFSTGDQENISNDGRLYNVWSLTEQLELGKLKAKVNWYLNASNANDLSAPTTPTGCTSSGTVPPSSSRFTEGERVFGPLSLFNSILYFTTYDPKSADKNACAAAYSYLWGVHYTTPGTDAMVKVPSTNPEEGALPGLRTDSGDPNAKPIRYQVMCPGSIAFGATVSQQPSCVAPPTPIPSDSFLMGGMHYTMNQMTPGPVQITVQAGKPTTGGQTNVSTINIPTPPGGASIDSWATIVE